ncbi:TetR/AcrR family transcriptional regulator [Pigmentiphaga sp.]|uniref:TetR/AcrR family transcriptional regulator n=1 Tax=Pigmentiphaga sp. TaxID=1977564 RepID=UPI00128BA561|nr:TetR/AcrR family transcriptional regulator [Pigmentiphaga sp.]MPS30609.1 TetR/AcrR family transcriptional regulator [Alcaligenaceae bacterium SAGV5]MPS53120.1 TetR/AcrR family transcriptional regulator [Alcaligenaceae bacterium SAGV3]MPT57699.1 TetR/AcrR family transcriptional regulator [Alcaligenaceae bacterium]
MPAEPSGAASTASRPRVRAPQNRRVELLDAAERLFLRKGVAQTSVDDITAGAQVSKGTFYLYFSSREELLGALRERFIQGFCERVDTAVRRRAAPGEKGWNARLRAWFAAMLDGLLDQVMLHDMLFHDPHPASRELMKDNPIITQLETLLEAGAEAGAWRVADSHAMAIMMFHSMHGLADDAVARGSTTGRARIVRRLTDTFAAALRAC